MTAKLSAEHEPNPVTVDRKNGQSAIVLSCDHASKAIPEGLGDLGLAKSELGRHIAWDIGAAGVSQYLSELLDAPLVLQNYSRLVIDCNRTSDHDQLIPLRCEATTIPGNRDLSVEVRAQRYDEIFRPYHETIAELLDQRLLEERSSAFVAIHSFTPSYLGNRRPWHIGILYGCDRRMAEKILEQLDGDSTCCVGDNEPYRIDEKDYGIPVHGEGRRLPHVLIELRQDLIETEAKQREWAEKLSPLLLDALNVVVAA
jgi:predicted N-formylglutamate amidohydrolase